MCTLRDFKMQKKDHFAGFGDLFDIYLYVQKTYLRIGTLTKNNSHISQEIQYTYNIRFQVMDGIQYSIVCSSKNFTKQCCPLINSGCPQLCFLEAPKWFSMYTLIDFTLVIR